MNYRLVPLRFAYILGQPTTSAMPFVVSASTLTGAFALHLIDDLQEWFVAPLLIGVGFSLTLMLRSSRIMAAPLWVVKQYSIVSMLTTMITLLAAYNLFSNRTQFNQQKQEIMGIQDLLNMHKSKAPADDQRRKKEAAEYQQLLADLKNPLI